MSISFLNSLDLSKHAYLILAHKNPGQLRGLLGILDDERNDIYVHIDKKAAFTEMDLDGCCNHSHIVFIQPRIAVNWGGVSIVRAEMALLAEATKTRHSYYHLLSGEDLPIKSQDAIHKFFEDNDGYEFLNLWPVNPSSLNRVHYRYPFPEGSHFFLTNLVNNLVYCVLKVLGVRRNTDIDFKSGSQWFSITHAAALYAVSRKEWVEKVFDGCRICDEFLMSTIIWNSEFRDRLYCKEFVDGHTINTSNMRYIDWNRGGSQRHPGIFTIADLDILRNIPHLWARKFDENVDRAIIDAIEEYVKS